MKLRPEILLHPNIPKPLHGTSPRTIFGQEWWDKNRRIAYAENQYCCFACGIHKSKANYHQWLEAHELYEYVYEHGRLIFREIVALCHSCHNYIHSGRMKIMVARGKMDQAKMDDILRRGDSIIQKAKIKRPKPPANCAEWSEWRLVIEGKEYEGKFETYMDWLKYYNYI